MPESSGTEGSSIARREAAVKSMMRACRQRFPAPGFQIASDDLGTVWVKRSDNGRSVGLQAWVLRGRSLDEVLERVEERLSRA